MSTPSDSSRPGLDVPGHPTSRADEPDAGSALDPTAGFASNVGTPYTTPLTGQTDRADLAQGPALVATRRLGQRVLG